MPRLKKIYALVLLPLLVAGLAGRASAAAGASLYLSPATADLAPGQVINLDIHESSGSEPINIVQLKLSYPADQLQFVSLTSAAAFNSLPIYPDVTDNGVISLLRIAFPISASQPGPTGDQVVASLQFKVLATAGSPAVTFNGSPAVYSALSHANIAGATTGSLFNIKIPPAPLPAPATAAPLSTSISFLPTKTPLPLPFTVRSKNIPAKKPIYEKSISKPDKLRGYYNGDFSGLGQPAADRPPADPAPAAALLLFLLLLAAP